MSKNHPVNHESPTGGQTLDKPNDQNQKHVLLVGDWVVDENWTVATHQSKTSTEPVETHYRSIVMRNAAVYSFCGAGRVGRALYWMNRYPTKAEPPDEVSDKPRLHIYGLGLWAKGDGSNLRRLFAPGITGGSNPYELFGKGFDKDPEPQLDGVDLINLAEYLELEPEEKPCTTHVYRVFRSLKDGSLDLVQRIDWESPAADFNEFGQREWQLSQNKIANLFRVLNNKIRGKSIDAIIVKCLSKGVISPLLIQQLKAHFPAADWFISSKHGEPAWLDEIIKGPGPGKLKLLFLPPIPIGNSKEVIEWIKGKGEVSPEAIDFLEKRKQKYFADNPSTSALVVMPRGLSIVALSQKSGSWTLYATHRNDEYDNLSGRIGKASIFFASLIANMLFVDDPFDLVIRRSLDRTLAWRKNEEQRLSGDPQQQQETAYDPDLLYDKEESQAKWQIAKPAWEDCLKQQKDSRKHLGIIPNPEGADRIGGYFDLWRGMSVVDGYVALEENRRRNVLRLFSIVNGFLQPETRPYPPSSISCLLVDDPGWGKTTLVSSMAKQLDVPCLKFNISQMLKKEDIINCFDVIVTTQSQQRDKPIIVFIDEIDSEALGTTGVYDVFLAPLEEGIYLRGGNSFRIDPCIWIFAGTKNPELLDRTNKARDFISRLTHKVIYLKGPQDQITAAFAIDQIQRLQNVYLGIALLRARYQDLKYVTPTVLHAFHCINPGVSIRRIRHYVERVRDVQYATVSERNLPPHEDILEKGEFDKTEPLPQELGKGMIMLR